MKSEMKKMHFASVNAIPFDFNLKSPLSTLASILTQDHYLSPSHPIWAVVFERLNSSFTAADTAPDFHRIPIFIHRGETKCSAKIRFFCGFGELNG